MNNNKMYGSFLFTVFFFLHATIFHFTCLFYKVIHILISIDLFLISGCIIVIVLLHLLFLLVLHIVHLSLSSFLVLVFGNCLVIFSLIHIILLVIVLWCILNQMSIWRWFNINIILCVWNSISWWWNGTSLVLVVEFNTL